MPAGSPPAEHHSLTRAGLGLRLLAVVTTVAFAVPFLHLLTKAGDAPEVLGADGAWAPLWRTLQLAVAVTLACALIGTAMAWVTMRSDIPGRRVLRVLAALPLVIPSFAGAAALVAAFARGGLLDELLSPLGVGSLPEVRGFAGAFVVLCALSYPYVYLPVAARLGGLPPSLEESAAMMGLTRWATFRRIVLPQITSSMTAGSMLVFLYVASDFGAVQIARYDTLTRQIYASRLLHPEASATFGLLLALVALAVTVAERAVARRQGTSAPWTGRPASVLRLRRWRPVVTVFAWGVVVFTLVAPVVVLGWWAVRGAAPGALRSQAGSLWVPLGNSAWVSIVAAVVTIVVVFPLAWLSGRERSRLAGWLGSVVTAGFALPGLVIALSLVTVFLRTPLYLTYVPLIVAYAAHFGGQALRTMTVTVGSLPARVSDAARLLGAPRLRRWWAVELPLLAPGFAAAAGLVLLATLKELPATLLLAPIGFETLATRIWSSTEDVFLAEAGEAAVVLIALSGLLTWRLVIRRIDLMR